MSRCHNCGATPLPLARFCDHCGTQVKVEAIGDPVAQALQRLESSSEYAEAVQAGPRNAAPLTRGGKPPYVLWVVLVIIGIVILRDLRSVRGFELDPASVLPILFLAFPILALLRRGGRSRAYQAQDLETAAVHVSEADPWEDPGLRYPLVAHLELRSGERRRVRVTRNLGIHLQDDDYGVAFLKGDVLVDFQRIRMTP